MRKIIFILFLCTGFYLVLNACNNTKKTSDHFITGQLKNASSTTVYLESLTDSGVVVLDSAKTDKEGKFELPNRSDKLDYFMFRVDAANAVYLVLQGDEQIVMNGDAKDLENTYTIEGSKDCELIRQLKRFDKFLADSLFYTFKTASAAHPEKRDELIKASQVFYSQRMENYARQFIDLYPTSIVTLSVTRYLDQAKEENLVLLDSLNKSLSARYPENVYVRKFAASVEEAKFLPPGSQAPDINLPDTAGVYHKLSALRGKVVLIDFWASWCKPCRQENPHVADIYQRYKSKGFEIVGVSLDEIKENWKQAIQADHLTWLHVSELKKWDAEVTKEYHVSAIPFTVLIDRNGKIIAKGLQGDELEQMLKKVL